VARIAKKRLDQILVDRGLAESRSRAQALIMAGKVYADTKRLDKAGQAVSDDIALEVKGQDHPWVSRGGVKDVLLTRGAARVYAVDVGHGQLAWKLRSDPRVVVMEKTNARHLSVETIEEPLDLVVCDASFISLKTVLPAAMSLARPGAYLLALIKPQFEAGREAVGKKGVVRDPAVHTQICDDMTLWMDQQAGWQNLGITPSPLRGPEGNIEFLMAAQQVF